MTQKRINLSGTMQLKKGEEKRLLAGHLWVFSNEIDTKTTPLKQYNPGDWVELFNQRNKSMGIAYVNPQSLISLRIMHRHGFVIEELLQQRLQRALTLRDKIYTEPYYRWVYAEADYLPGLVIDRYAELVIVQINTAGMEVHKDAIIAAIKSCVSDAEIIIKNDSSIRELEGMPLYVEDLTSNKKSQLKVIENELEFVAPLSEGQKTGWFFDQRDNRLRAKPFFKNAKVLDLYSYLGAWGVTAACAGASEVICVDSAPYAKEYTALNAELNGVADIVSAEQGDVEVYLNNCIKEGTKFDVVVVDPPALIKRRKDVDKGEGAYARINRLAMQVLAADGYLISCSCSHHLAADRLQSILRGAAVTQKKQLQILATGAQAMDHPVHPAMPETQYLKAFYCRLV